MSNSNLSGKDYRRRFAVVADRDEWTWWLCGGPVDRDLPRDHREAGTLDHVKALRDGGINAMTNLRLAHARCNNERDRRRRKA
jgi:5-methylcytosine-specific restriction endonuclease McrA